MTTFSALPALVSSVLTRLRGDATLTGMVSGIYDEPPAAPGFPYVVIDDPFETPDRTFGQGGRAATLIVSVFTQIPATSKSGSGPVGFTVGLTIAQQVCALLTNLIGNPITVDGFDLVDADVESVEGFRLTDGKTRRIDVVVSFALEEHLS